MPSSYDPRESGLEDSIIGYVDAVNKLRGLTVSAVAIALAALALAGISQSATASTHSHRSAVISDTSAATITVDSMVVRLSIMPEVAYTKYRKNIEICDPVREDEQIRIFVAAANKRGINPRLAESVFRDQMMAAKQVQWKLFQQWNSGQAPLPTHEPLDIATQLRPLIDKANDTLLAALQQAQDQRFDPAWQTQVDAAVRAAAARLPDQVGRVELETAVASLRTTAINS